MGVWPNKELLRIIFIFILLQFSYGVAWRTSTHSSLLWRVENLKKLQCDMQANRPATRDASVQTHKLHWCMNPLVANACGHSKQHPLIACELTLNFMDGANQKIEHLLWYIPSKRSGNKLRRVQKDSKFLGCSERRSGMKGTMTTRRGHTIS